MGDSQGYQPDFMGPQLRVPLPVLSSSQRADASPELAYTHFSVLLSKARRFPYFTATNINGALFRPISREQVFASGTDEWTLDPRATAYQWGPALYSAQHSDFQRGHMTKREDPQWGTPELARRAAQETFHFSNCVPQVQELNTAAWGNLERFILQKQSVKYQLLVNVFTGPALLPDDPIFVTRLAGRKPLLLPKFFWKVVYYTNDGQQLSRAAFLMGQREALLKKGIAKEPTILTKLLEFRSMLRQQHYFEDYKDAALYQVTTGFLERLTGLRFAPAAEVFTADQARDVVFKRVQVPITEQLRTGSVAATPALPLEYTFDNLVL